MNGRLDQALKLYDQAKASMIATGLPWELDWQRSRRLATFDETEFLRETAWVILCSGFREAIVRTIFDRLSLCFCDWESAREIVTRSAACRLTALVVFRNPRKIDAIIAVAHQVENVGYPALKEAIMRDPLAELRSLPFIGPITSWHLAKNLGLDTAKPDRHLTRLSSAFGFKDAHDLCRAVAAAAGEPISVVDIVLWRHAASGKARSA